MDSYKIAVFSDSHGSSFHMLPKMRAHRDADVFVHLGDGYYDFIQHRPEFADVMFLAVRGNCDIGADLPPYEDTLTLGKHRIFLTHGAHLGVQYDTLRLEQAAMERGVEIALYGHTHIKEVRGAAPHFYVANPGSITLPRDGGRPSFLVIELHGDEVRFF